LPASKSLISFIGGPWTLFVYAVEGSHAGSLIKSKKDASLYKQFAETLVPLLIENIKLQFAGGAEVVMIFDTATGELDATTYRNLVYPDLEKLAKQFPGKIGYYSRGTQESHLKTTAFNSTLWAGVGVDWRWDLPQVIKNTKQGFVQGNFDQSFLFCKPSEFEFKLNEYLKPLLKLSPDERAGWVCGLGHGVLPATPEDNVRTFIKTVREVFA
jgi:uroporphyrinogen decarboxylase